MGSSLAIHQVIGAATIGTSRILGLGEVEQARAQLTVAMENSTTRKEHELYAAKLDRIRLSGRQ